jgi:hypothetical protein
MASGCRCRFTLQHTLPSPFHSSSFNIQIDPNFQYRSGDSRQESEPGARCLQNRSQKTKRVRNRSWSLLPAEYDTCWPGANRPKRARARYVLVRLAGGCSKCLAPSPCIRTLRAEWRSGHSRNRRLGYADSVRAFCGVGIGCVHPMLTLYAWPGPQRRGGCRNRRIVVLKMTWLQKAWFNYRGLVEVLRC